MVNIFYTNELKRAAKKLLKKYPSLPNDLADLEADLAENPNLGDQIYDKSKEIRKIRLAIKSKGKGKSGSARVITLLMNKDSETQTVLGLFIYDKQVYSNVNEAFIIDLIEQFEDDNSADNL